MTIPLQAIAFFVLAPIVLADNVIPSIIGADGLEFTQVEFAQDVLRLSGAGVRIAIFDDGLDIRHPNFGRCTAVKTPEPPVCRVVAGWSAFPGGLLIAGSEDAHGTHVAGIAAGAFPDKLFDDQNLPFKYQRGVAYQGLIGAYKILATSDEDETNSLRDAVDVAVRDKMHIINLSLGTNTWVPVEADAQGIQKAAAAGILMAAAAGNEGQEAGLQSVIHPSWDPNVFSVAMLANTVTAGAAVVLSDSVTFNGSSTNRLVANQRADTAATICYPRCNSLGLPLPLVYSEYDSSDYHLTLGPGGGSGDGRSTKVKPPPDGFVLVVRVPDDADLDNMPSDAMDLMSQVYELGPKLILFAVPAADASTYSDVDNYPLINGTLPVLFFVGQQAEGLVAAAQAGLLLINISNVLIDIDADVAMQYSPISTRGPDINLRMKPDIAAPGFQIYSSTPFKQYQTWTGTSMATPYLSGVLALWRESKRGIEPPGGWIAAAMTALKNTARPFSYRSPANSSELMWPPAFVGAGVVQAAAAVTACVRIAPTELLLRSGAATQTATFTITNECLRGARTFRLAHNPAFALNMAQDYFGKSFDRFNADAVAPASVRLSRTVVSVGPGASATVTATITLSPALRSAPYIYSGYFILTPRQRHNLTQGLRSGNVQLSLPYQGCSRDYSDPAQVPLVVQDLPKTLAAKSGAICLGFVDDTKDVITCDNDVTDLGVVRVSLKELQDAKNGKGLGFLLALARPVQELVVEIYAASDNTTIIGTASYGPCAKTLRGELSYLPSYSALNDFSDTSAYDACTGVFRGRYTPAGTEDEAVLRVGGQYTFQLLLRAPVAAADSARVGGRQQDEGGVLRVPMRGVLQITGS